MDKIVNITIHYGSVTKRTDTETSKINKERLNKIVRKELNFSKEKHFLLTRKSKRSKDYVPLEDNSDFRALKRSLEVKNHLKLKVKEVHGAQGTAEEKQPATQSQDQTVSIPEGNYKKLMNMIEDIHKSVIKEESSPTSLASKIENLNLAVHYGVFCDVCNPFGNNYEIMGDRYKCKECFDYDLCSKCYKSGKANNAHSSNHLMDKITIPAARTRSRNSTSYQIPPPSYPCTLKEATSKIDHNCIFVDIPVDTSSSKEYETEIVDLVKTYDDVAKLKELKAKLSAYNDLLQLTNNDEHLLSAVVKSYADSKKDDKEAFMNPKLVVEVSKIDQTLVFHLQNKGSCLTPKNLNLIFSYLSEGSLTKFSLSIGPHSIYPNGHKRLYYNMNGIESDFNFKDKCTIELVDERNQIYASGLCDDGSGIIKLDESKLNNLLPIVKDEPSLIPTSCSSSTETPFEAYMTPSSSAFVDDFHSGKEVFVEENNDSTDEDVAPKVPASEDVQDQGLVANETIQSSTTTLTPEFIEIHNADTESENIGGISSDFTDEDIEDDDNDDESFSDDYEVLSTEDYTD